MIINQNPEIKSDAMRRFLFLGFKSAKRYIFHSYCGFHFAFGKMKTQNPCYSLPSEKLDVAALRAATLILGFIWLFLWWEGSRIVFCFQMSTYSFENRNILRRAAQVFGTTKKFRSISPCKFGWQ